MTKVAPSAFLKDRRGSVGVLSALLLLPMIGALGASVEYTKFEESRRSLQNALDAAVLAALREPDAASAEARVLQVLRIRYPEVRLRAFDYLNADGERRILTQAEILLDGPFLRLLGELAPKASASAEAVAPEALSDVRLRMESASGAFIKDMILFGVPDAADPSTRIELARMSYVYNGEPGYLGTWTSSTEEWINIGAYEDVYFEMHIDPKSDFFKRKEHDEILRPHTPEHAHTLLVNDVMQAPGDPFDLLSDTPCGVETRFSMEDSNDLPPDFHFLMWSACNTINSSKRRLLR